MVIVLLSVSCGPSPWVDRRPVPWEEVPPAPWFHRFLPNAYEGVGEFDGKVELDNMLYWRPETRPETAEKEFWYYAFRVTVKSESRGDYHFAWCSSEGPLEDCTPIEEVEGPCPMEEQGDQRHQMAEESKKYTGKENGPAIYSEELMFAQLESLATVWRTCEPEFVVEDEDIKGKAQRNYTILLNSTLVPGRITVRVGPSPSGWDFGRPLGIDDQLSAAAVIDIVPSPFRMAAIGDSVMWGEGLVDDDKFSVRIERAIEEETQQIVRSWYFAHAGASLGSSDVGENAQVYPGVQRISPTINWQLTQIPQPERLDLLLLNGCINNIDTVAIATGVEFGSKDFAEFTDAIMADRIERQCHLGMKVLLTEAREIAPNARIIVVGYFPLLSHRSDRQCTVRLTMGGVAVSAGLAVGLLCLTYLAPFLWVDPWGYAEICGFGTSTGMVATYVIEDEVLHAFLEAAEDRSRNWVRWSDDALATAVEEAENDHPEQVGAGSLIWVEVAQRFGNSDGFLGHEAFTEIPYLYGVDCDLGPDPEEEEATVNTRATPCAAFDYTNDIWREGCYRASAFHPNAAGADVYYGRIERALRGLRILPRRSEEP